LDAAFAPGAARPLARSLAEVEETYKQLVCYVVLIYGCEIFHYQRSPRGGETRLAGLRSIGVGGHVNLGDGDQLSGRSTLVRGIRRELTEEVKLPVEPAIDLIGVINDDSNEVGRVHLGIVATAHISSRSVELRDSALIDGRFDPVETLIANQTEFETWSRLCLPTFARLMSRDARAGTN
jgi:predicted NUDIX family phosphoesterase